MTTIDALSVATGGLANVNRGIGILSHNIANANTPGYVRENATQTAASAGGLSMGVASGPPTRDIDAALQDRLMLQTAAAGGAGLSATGLQQIDALHGKPGGGSDLVALLAGVEDGALAPGQGDAPEGEAEEGEHDDHPGHRPLVPEEGPPRQAARRRARRRGGDGAFGRDGADHGRIGRPGQRRIRGSTTM